MPIKISLSALPRVGLRGLLRKIEQSDKIVSIVFGLAMLTVISLAALSFLI